MTAASLNPYTYNIAMNAETAKKKGIKDGDTICLENRFGDKQTGKVKLSPVGTSGGGGSGRSGELGQGDADCERKRHKPQCPAQAGSASFLSPIGRSRTNGEG